MPVPLTALFAASLYQVRAADGDAAAMDRALSLLARAAGGTPVTFEILNGRFLVNDMPVSIDAPGVTQVMEMMLGHDTAKLCLPANLEPRHWREVSEIFASAAGLFPAPIHLIEALHAAVPGAELVSAGKQGEVVDSSAGGLSAEPHQLMAPGEILGSPDLTSQTNDRAVLTTRLDPLLAEGSEAAARHDYDRLATALIELRALEDELEDAQRSIVVRERRRMVSSDELEVMVRLLAKPGTSPLIARAINSAGRDGIEAIIEVLNAAEGRPERRACIEALAAAPGAEEAILKALTSHRPDLVVACAEVAARRHMEKSVHQLGHLLKHNDANVRTAAYHALERIGTPAAFEALHGRAVR